MSVNLQIWPRGGLKVQAAPAGWGAATDVPKFGELTSVQASSRYEVGFCGWDLATINVRPAGNWMGGLFRPGDHMLLTRGGRTIFEGMVAGVVPGEDGTQAIKGRGYAYAAYDADSIYAYVGAGDDYSYPTTQLFGSDADNLFGWDYARTMLDMPLEWAAHDPLNGYWGETPVATQPVSVGEVLTALATTYGTFIGAGTGSDLRWTAWGRGVQLEAPTDLATATWEYDAPDALVGVEDSDYYNQVGIWHVAYVPGNEPNDWQVVWVNGDTTTFAPRSVVVDYRGLGPISAAEAGELGQVILDKVKGRFLLSGSFSVTDGSGWRRAGGGTADPHGVRAGEVLQLNNLRTSQGNLWQEGSRVRIGKAEYQWRTVADGEEESMTITPEGAAPRSFSDILRGVPFDQNPLLSGTGYTAYPAGYGA